MAVSPMLAEVTLQQLPIVSMDLEAALSRNELLII